MSPEKSRAYVLSLYEHLLRRAPNAEELENWITVAQNRQTADQIYFSFVNSEEYRAKHCVSTLYPSGHYYSPVVDPKTVTQYVRNERLAAAPIAGVNLSLAEMEAFWNRCSPVVARTPFHQNENTEHRYYFDNTNFSYADAITLRAMMADLKPRTVVEIGSGFSSACMLDCADEFGLDTKFTFIDPDTSRLELLLRPADHERVTTLKSSVQATDLSLYQSLQAADILFIDSTHVLKTGSDVHFELFYIMPALNKGVVVHFHDIHFPFEYPDPWIFKDNLSWNEIYALRAFLMYNSDFRVRFWGGYFVKERLRLVEAVSPLFLKNTGGSIWLERD